MEVLTPAQLKRLDKHKYTSSGTSLIEPYFQVYWRWIVEYFPLWMAPNLITVVGLFINIVTSFIIMCYSPTASEPGPSWIYFINAIGLFAYQTLDAIDGKQARRTGSSTPLGELFDHGCDSISTVFVAIALSASILLGRNPDTMFWMCMCSVVLFYFGHWVSYVTGTLHFGKIDVTEVQLATIGCFLFTGFFGPEVWENKLPIIAVSLKTIPVVFVFAGSLMTSIRFAKLIIEGGCGPNGSTVAGTSVLFPFFNILIVFVFALTIAKKSTITIFENHPILYILFFGIVGAKVTNRLVVAHMTCSELNLLDTSLIGPAFLFLNQYFNSCINEYLLLWLCMLHASVDLLQYLMYTYKQIARHLGIYIFSLAKPEPEEKTTEKVAKLK